MCGGASKVMIRDLNIPDDMKICLKVHSLETAQNILDEGSTSLKIIGLGEDDIAGLSEAIHQETGQWLD